jgi:hypothetical protein
MDMNWTLHGGKGGKKPKGTHVPSEREAFALVTGAALLWSLSRSSDNPQFYSFVAEEVKRVEGTLQSWSKSEMVDLFHNKAFCGIGQDALKTYLQADYRRTTLSHKEWVKGFVDTSKCPGFKLSALHCRVHSN